VPFREQYYALSAPFLRPSLWAMQVLILPPLPCEGSALPLS
jgi:hypothetical protein